MDRAFLRTLSCPYCGRQLEIAKIFSEDGMNLTNAIVNCECDRYPIVEGILVLRKGTNIKNAVEFLERNKILQAQNVLIEPKPYSLLGLVFLELEKIDITLCHRISLFLKKMMNKPIFEGHTFFETIDRLKWRSWGEYLKYRFSAPTFFEILPLIQLIKQTKKAVLDVACGVGHSSFVISNYVPEEKIVCVDRLFVHLYLAKKFFVKNAKFICLDANSLLPFTNKVFSSIFCLDALHYISSKFSLAREFIRTLDHDGVLLLPHLHNSLKFNPNPGEPLTPQGYADLFNNLEIRLIPEKNLIESFLLKNELDLEKKFSEAEINSSNAITLVASENKGLFKLYENLDTNYVKKDKKLVINPIYKVIERGDSLYLTADYPRHQVSYFPLMKKYLPKSCVIEKDIFTSIKNRKIAKKREKMIKNFVLIGVPKNYI